MVDAHGDQRSARGRGYGMDAHDQTGPRWERRERRQTGTAGTERRARGSGKELFVKPWAGETVAILGTGPSLTQADVDACRGVCKVIAIKDAMYLAPWADALYFCGAGVGDWWIQNQQAVKSFAGLRFTLDARAKDVATVLRNTGEFGLEEDPTGLRTGRNSGYQAINLAYHLGATRILLLGFDMQGSHYFGAHSYTTPPSPFDVFRRCFEP